MPQTPVAAVLDPTVVDQLRELLGAALAPFVDTFLDDTAAQIMAMENALRSNDALAIGRRAHSLKSSSIAIGAARLGALCSALEIRVREGSAATDVEPDVQEIRSVFSTTRQAYEDLSTATPASPSTP